MLPRLAAAFERRFGRAPELAARAPGRVNLIGEHTDYNEGWVLPCALDRATLAIGARRADRRLRCFSLDEPEAGEIDPAALEAGRGWLDYVQGVLAALAERGLEAPGLDLGVASDVPRGSGLSSSAALTVALSTLLDLAGGLRLGPLERARLAHRAENGFVGVACGLMDPLASALGQRGHALLIDCRSVEIRPVPLPPGLRLLVADSGVRRRLVAGDYNRRRAECEEALARARAAGALPPEARALRDATAEDLPRLEAALPATLFRRVRHVVSENQRVGEVAAALARGDLTAAGEGLRAGMRSLRLDFEVSVPELDALCELADRHPAVYGSRLTGAGFGGCSVHLVAEEAAEAAARALAEGFAARFGRRPPVLVATPSDGAGALALG